MKYFFLLLQVFLLISNPAISQKPFESKPKAEVNYFTKFDNYTIKQGLSSNYISKIIQDNYGFLWFATDNGLNRFDGYRFIVFKNDSKDTNTISDNNITSLAVDNFNNLWIGTRKGLNKLDLTTYKITRFYHSENIKNSIADNWIRALFADKEGFLYIETTDGAFHKYDIKNNKFKFFKHNGREDEIYPMHQIYQDKEGIIWIGGSNTEGLFEFDKRKDKLTSCFFKEYRGSFCAFLEDKHNNFYLGNHGSTIHLLNKSTMTLKEIPLTSIYKIIEDLNGNIWFGGYGSGAVKYNVIENKLTFYKHISDNPCSIIADQVLDIYEDKSGCIWFGTKLGVSKLSFRKYKFEHYFHIAGSDKSVSSNRIYSCANDNDSIVWLGTWDNGLDKFNRNTGIFQNFKFGKEKTSIGSNNVTGIALDKSKNNLWISVWNGFYGGALNKFDKKKNLFTRYNVGDNWLHNVFIDSKENVWTIGWGAGTGLTLFNKNKGEPDTIHFSKNTVPGYINFLKAGINNILWCGLSYYNIENKQFYGFAPIYKKYENYDINIKKTESVPNVTILKNPPVLLSQLIISMVIDKYDNNWLCYDNGTLLKYVSSTKTFEYFTINENILTASAEKNNNIWFTTKNNIVLYNTENNKKRIVLNIENIRSLFEDNYYNLWLASDKSVYKYNIITKQLLHVLNISNALISSSENKEYILACSSEGIFKINCKSSVKEVLSNQDYLKKISNTSINCIYIFKNETIFIGTSKGLFQVNIKNKETIKYTHDDKNEYSISSNNVMAIELDKSGNIWIGTEKGLSRFNYKDEKFINITEANKNSLSSGLTTCALEDKKGNFWVGTSDAGLNLINISDKTVQHFYNHSYDTTSLSDKYVNCVFQDSKGIIWIGTEKGLNKFEANKKTFKHYTIKNGFPDNAITGILEDEHYNLWVSTGKGLVKFNIKKELIEIFTLMDGLQDDEFSKACCKFSNGEMLFGGYNGFNIFHPDSIKRNNYLPPVGITAMWINDSLIKYSIQPNALIELPYNSNNVTFEFTAFDYNFPEKNKFSYFLEGFDAKWSMCNASMRITKYTNIPDGKYKFKLKAANNDGIWNKDVFVINIVIFPPWWKTWWFRTAAILFIIIVVYFYIKWRERKLKREKAILEKKVKIRTHQLNEANEELKQQKEEIIAQCDHLEVLNTSLGQANEEITAQRDLILESNEELQQQKEEIMTQRDLIEEKNREVTDSINYAKRIQEAVLPVSASARAVLGEHFILFKPKDIVSGDFYWTTKIVGNRQSAVNSPQSAVNSPQTADCKLPTADLLIVVVADCTGHGVPGALMSMLGISFLTEIVNKKEVTQASHVLNELRKEIINALQQKGTQGEQKDGMDIALVTINTETIELQYAGANNPLYIFSHLNNELIEIKPDKMPIAIYEQMEQFTNNDYQLQKGDLIYLLSDGYEDQFGGPKNKKFMIKQLKELFVKISDKQMNEQEEILNTTFEKWKGEHEQIDDVTILGLKI